MTFFPEISDHVTILRGRHAGKVGVVKAIDASQESPIYVVDINPELNFADWLRPDDIERFSVPEPVVSKVDLPPVPPMKSMSAEEADQIITFYKRQGRIRQIVGRKIASAKTIDTHPPSAWRQVVADGYTYLGYTAYIDAIENGEDT